MKVMNLDSAVFYSHNIETVIPFYRDVLGFTLEYQQGDAYVSFLFPNNVSLGIKKAIEPREVPGSQTVFISLKSGIEDFYAQLREEGITPYKELVTQAWGINFSVLDPDGNKVQFVQRHVPA